MFAGWKARLEQLLAASEVRDRGPALRVALVEMRAALATLRAALAPTERELEGERQALADAERRGGLAASIGDQETAELALRFVEKHRVRIEMLERKLGVQRDEIVYAEREIEELTVMIRGLPGAAAAASAEAAWRELDAAGAARPGTDLDDDLMKQKLTQAQRERAVQEQLDYLKKKMGKEGSGER